MKLYRDKDPYVYRETLYDKKKKEEDKVKRIVSALLACEIVLTSGLTVLTAKYEFDHSNPFDGSKITSSNFSSNYKAMKARSFLEDEDFKETIEYIKNADIDEKKAYLLYYAILSNESLEKQEKEMLKGYIQYFIDNKYLDYEYVYDKLFSIKISERNAKFPGTNISSQYSPSTNSIKLGIEEDLSHEVEHSMMDVKDYPWIDEGYNSIISSEYHNDRATYAIESNVIRVLCEMIGKEEGRECFFKVAATNDINLLTQALVEKGIDESYCEELYTLLNEYVYGDTIINDMNQEEERRNLRKKISGLLAIMIKNSNIILNDDTNAIIYEHLSKISLGLPTKLENDKFYYFNSEKIKEYSSPIQFYYYCPLSIYKDILKQKNKSLDLIACQEINGIDYVEVSGEFISEINSKDLLIRKLVFVGYKQYLYELDNITGRFEYIETFTRNLPVENYISNYEYYQKSK